MTKVITYGTYDLIHHGHIRLLERAKALGDYLIVGVTADDFDKTRGKINVTQSLMERIEGVKATGLADEIIVEEYEGQKIDDVRRYSVDIFTVGSDWIGKFDYLCEYCEVVYLDRTYGISSTELRSKQQSISIGLVGGTEVLNKYKRESMLVNGIIVKGIYSYDLRCLNEAIEDGIEVYESFDELLKEVNAVYIIYSPDKQYDYVKKALSAKCNVLCEAPIALTVNQKKELFHMAKSNDLVLMEAIKTAYSTAYNRLLLLVKTGVIGKITSITTTCTRLNDIEQWREEDGNWGSLYTWGPTALLPVFQLLGVKYKKCTIVSKYSDKEKKMDIFSKIDLVYEEAIASILVGNGVKSEGEMIISGTQGYIYVPAPWWKTDYYEVRYENPSNNKRYFYQLEGEGIRYEMVAFLKSIINKKNNSYIDDSVSFAISDILEKYKNREVIEIV